MKTIAYRHLLFTINKDKVHQNHPKSVLIPKGNTRVFEKTTPSIRNIEKKSLKKNIESQKHFLSI